MLAENERKRMLRIMKVFEFFIHYKNILQKTTSEKLIIESLLMNTTEQTQTCQSGFLIASRNVLYFTLPSLLVSNWLNASMSSVSLVGNSVCIKNSKLNTYFDKRNNSIIMLFIMNL